MAVSLYWEFRAFLRECGCEREFDENFEAQHPGYYLDERLADYMVVDETLVDRCFRWDLTPQGREFWREIEMRWWRGFVNR